jgi:hypothetical protein
VVRFHEASEKLSSHLGSKFLYGSDIIMYRTYHNFDAEESQAGDPDVYSVAKDPIGVNRRRFHNRMDLHEVKKQSYDNAKPMIYSIIWGQCSTSMKQKLRDNPDYLNISTTQNALLMWQKIKNVSLSGHLTVNPVKMRLEWEQSLDAIRQRDDVTTGSYYHRFRLEFDAMQAAGVEIVAAPFVPATVAEQKAMAQELLKMEDKIMAMKFLRKLDRKRYGNWLDHLENDVSSRPSYMPVAHLDTQISRIHNLDI